MTPPSGAGTKLNEGVKLQTFAYRNECLMVIPLAQTLHTFKSVTDKKTIKNIEFLLPLAMCEV